VKKSVRTVHVEEAGPGVAQLFGKLFNPRRRDLGTRRRGRKRGPFIRKSKREQRKKAGGKVTDET